MFYSYELLCLRKNGRYSVIWFAATHGFVARKADVLKVDIAATCDELIETVKLPPKKKYASKRISLYLASMLMHGAAIVFKSQVDWFLVEVMNYMEKCHQLAAARITHTMRNLDEATGKKRKVVGKEGSPVEKRRRVPKKKHVSVLDSIELALPRMPEDIQISEETVMQQIQEAQHIQSRDELFLEPSKKFSREEAIRSLIEPPNLPELFGPTDSSMLAEIINTALVQKESQTELRAQTTDSLALPTKEQSLRIEAPEVDILTSKEMLDVPPEVPLPALEPIVIDTDHPTIIAPESVTLAEHVEPPAGETVTTVMSDVQEATKTTDALPQLPVIQVTEATPSPRKTRRSDEIISETKKRKKVRRNIFEKDANTSFSLDEIKAFPHAYRVNNPQDDVPEIATEFEDPLDFVWYFHKMWPLKQVRQARRSDEQTVEEELRGSSRFHSLSSRLSAQQEEAIKKLLRSLDAIPEQVDGSKAQVLQTEGAQELPGYVVPPIQEEILPMEPVPLEVESIQPPVPMEVESIQPPVPMEVESIQPLVPMEVESIQPPVPMEIESIQPPAPKEIESIQPPGPKEPAELLPVLTEQLTTAEQLVLPEQSDLPEQSCLTETDQQLKSTILESTNREIRKKINQNPVTTFADLCPLRKVTRQRAAQIFSILLHMKKDNLVDLQQETPYGEIKILKQ